MRKFTPVSEDEYKSRNVWPSGWYAATVLTSIERLSMKGDLMFETDFQVFNNEGKFRTVKFYIMAEGRAKFQLRSFAEAFGLLDKYKDASLTEDDLIDKSGFVKLSVQEDATGTYAPKNAIVDFRSSIPGTVKASDLPKLKPMTKKETQDTLGESDIPF